VLYEISNIFLRVLLRKCFLNRLGADIFRCGFLSFEIYPRQAFPVQKTKNFQNPLKVFGGTADITYRTNKISRDRWC